MRGGRVTRGTRVLNAATAQQTGAQAQRTDAGLAGYSGQVDAAESQDVKNCGNGPTTQDVKNCEHGGSIKFSSLYMLLHFNPSSF